MGLFRKKLSPEQFWDWLLNNIESIRTVTSPNDKAFKEFRKHLNQIQEGLAFEMGHLDENTFHIIISAEGIAERFPAVNALRNTVPPLPPGLKIDFFRQPQPGVDCIEMGGLRLCKSEIYFRVQPERDPLPFNLTLYMPTHAITDLGKSMSFILLDKTTGEEFVVTRIGPIDWLDVANKPEDAKPLVELYESIRPS